MKPSPAASQQSPLGWIPGKWRWIPGRWGWIPGRCRRGARRRGCTPGCCGALPGGSRHPPRYDPRGGEDVSAPTFRAAGASGSSAAPTPRLDICREQTLLSLTLVLFQTSPSSYANDDKTGGCPRRGVLQLLLAPEIILPYLHPLRLPERNGWREVKHENEFCGFGEFKILIFP